MSQGTNGNSKQANCLKRGKSRVNVQVTVTLVVSFSSDWSKGWRVFSKQIKERNKRNLSNSRLLSTIN